ncbi:hypothetical protein T03_3630 [Trichinella britovi]|uniref:Uncharacterized protein n=1 Tax=Trichinella britovi TaxID=45882 RepID=A0A0V0YXU0_TRIBR|nr:hypothetical protein T03_3630 [Trichinella britovi]
MLSTELKRKAKKENKFDEQLLLIFLWHLCLLLMLTEDY